MEEDMPQTMQGHSISRQVKRPVPTERRRHLLAMSIKIVDEINKGCEEHERKLLFQMIEVQFYQS